MSEATAATATPRGLLLLVGRKAVSRKTAAGMYEVGVDVIDRAIHSGALAATKVGGKPGPDGELVHFRYRINVDDLERWFASLPTV